MKTDRQKEPDREKPRIRVSMAELYPTLCEVIGQGRLFRIPVTGTSMIPTIQGDWDEVLIGKAEFPLKKYDIPLYRRDNGQFVLHRVISVEPDGTYTCCGDHQWVKEPGIRPDQIVGAAAFFIRKGKQIDLQSAGFRRWSRFWHALMPIRRPLVALYSKFQKLHKKK